MATFLLAWEMGSGLGHLLPLRCVGEELIKRGHRVFAVLRDLSRAADVLNPTGITYLPCPVMPSPRALPFPRPAGFVHVLVNVGFSDEQLLSGVFTAWNNLFDLLCPDLLVADHSPGALLAARGRDLPAVNMGIPFCCPPDTFPLPYWWNDSLTPTPVDQIARDELKLTEHLNRVLTSHNRPSLERLGQLFNQLDDVILATFRELDLYGERKKGRYWGHWHVTTGTAPNWPSAAGPKIYAYLKPFTSLESVLSTLCSLAHPTLIFSGGIDPALQQRFASPALRFENRPIDMARAVAECDLAILHAGHGTTASLLLAGKPCLLFPQQVEQLLTSQAVTKLGAGRWLPHNAGHQTAALLREMLSAEKYKSSAQAFAGRYHGFVPGEQLPAIADRLEDLAHPK